MLYRAQDTDLCTAVKGFPDMNPDKRCSMIPFWQLNCLAVWYQAGYRYRLAVGSNSWRFVFLNSASNSRDCEAVQTGNASEGKYSATSHRYGDVDGV